MFGLFSKSPEMVTSDEGGANAVVSSAVEGGGIVTGSTTVVNGEDCMISNTTSAKRGLSHSDSPDEAKKGNILTLDLTEKPYYRLMVVT